MNKPLIVYGVFDLNHLRGLKTEGHRLDFATLDQALKYRPSVVYMRVGHKLAIEDLARAMRIENEFRKRGTIIVNSMRNRIVGQRKDLYYAKLKEHGIPVPYSIPNPELNEIKLAIEMGNLRYPFLYRTVDGAGGHDIRLVNSYAGVQKAYSEFRVDHKRTIVCEFINSRKQSSFKKYRAYYAGGIDMYGTGMSSGWNVQDGTTLKYDLLDFMRANKRENDPKHLNPLVEKTARILGLDIFAMDIVPDIEKKRDVIVDINPTYVLTETWKMFSPEVGAWRSSHFSRVATFLCRKTLT